MAKYKVKPITINKTVYVRIPIQYTKDGTIDITKDIEIEILKQKVKLR